MTKQQEILNMQRAKKYDSRKRKPAATYAYTVNIFLGLGGSNGVARAIHRINDRFIIKLTW